MESESRDGKVRRFHHPFFQASCMFTGEMCCYLVYKIAICYFKRKGTGAEKTSTLTKGTRSFNVFIMLGPAMCDMLATSAMYVGLTMTYASSFQMLRGSVIIFTGLFSFVFLNRRMHFYSIIGIVLVIIGLALVGVADIILMDKDEKSQSTKQIIIGDSLIIAAQLICAVQFVLEEKYVAGLDISSLQAIGWEGIFGFVVLFFLQIIFYWIPAGEPFTNNPRDVLEDSYDAFVQISNRNLLWLALTVMILSIAFFNFAGISITKELSATTRMVLDSLRTIVIWAFSLVFFGQKFQYLQLVGFAFLITGMFFYNRIGCRQICKPFPAKCKCSKCCRESPLEEGAELGKAEGEKEK